MNRSGLLTLDEQSWNPDALVDEHADYLFRFAQSRLKNSSGVEEVVQETLISAWKSREQFQGASAERTWLTGILKNKIIDRYRTLARDSERIDKSVDVAELDALFDASGHGLIPSNAWTGSPSNEAEKGEFWKIFDGCVAGLPERTGGVFIMREIDRMDSL